MGNTGPHRDPVPAEIAPASGDTAAGVSDAGPSMPQAFSSGQPTTPADPNGAVAAAPASDSVDSSPPPAERRAKKKRDAKKKRGEIKRRPYRARGEKLYEPEL